MQAPKQSELAVARTGAAAMGCGKSAEGFLQSSAHSRPLSGESAEEAGGDGCVGAEQGGCTCRQLADRLVCEAPQR
jgi:hypothetical protein